ncbi:MAG: phenylacetate--CoA ligase family protein [Phycisphaerae bacterium]
MTGLQREKLARLLQAVRASNPFCRAKLASIAFDPLSDSIHLLPLTTRDELQQSQADDPPYGRNLTFPLSQYTRLHQTSGSSSGGEPLRWLDTAESWEWWKRCWATIYDAAQVGPADRLVFPFSFGPFIGFWSAFESATARGNLCLAAGGMTTLARVHYIVDNAATVICCTPTFALRMAEAASREGVALNESAVRAVIVAGEPGGNIPETRAAIEAAWGARVFDHAGMTEMGAWGFEAIEMPGGLFVNEDEFIAECVDPATQQPVAEGELGELVLTNLGRIGSPLIRYRTGDLVRLTKCAVPASIQNPIPARRDKIQSRIGEWTWCIGGVLGRVDDMLIIRGNNVFPAAIEGIIRGVASAAEFQLRVERRGAMPELTVVVERAADASAQRVEAEVGNALRDRLHFRPRVEVVEPGVLPRFEMKARRIVRGTNAE